MFFHALTFAGSSDDVEHEADRPSVQHHPRDLASVNAMKQTFAIVSLAYLPYSSIINTENAAKTLNCPFTYTGFL